MSLRINRGHANATYMILSAKKDVAKLMDLQLSCLQLSMMTFRG